MSTHDPSSAHSSSSEKPPVDTAVVSTRSNASRIRSLILLGILVLLLGALWYDYKVARPGVERAFDSIAKLNEELNSQPGRKYVTNKEVQEKLHRSPVQSFQEGPYQVEVYSWRAGLPIRSHNYYAVYSAGTPLVFLKHYKFELPMEELEVMPMTSHALEVDPDSLPGEPTGFSGIGEAPRRQRPDTDTDGGEKSSASEQKSSGETSDAAESAKPGAKDDPSSTSSNEQTPASSPAKDEGKTDGSSPSPEKATKKTDATIE